jgi:hypothetical protein
MFTSAWTRYRRENLAVILFCGFKYVLFLLVLLCFLLFVHIRRASFEKKKSVKVPYNKIFDFFGFNYGTNKIFSIKTEGC